MLSCGRCEEARVSKSRVILEKQDGVDGVIYSSSAATCLQSVSLNSLYKLDPESVIYLSVSVVIASINIYVRACPTFNLDQIFEV